MTIALKKISNRINIIKTTMKHESNIPSFWQDEKCCWRAQV